jgi:hypothetical protein
MKYRSLGGVVMAGCIAGVIAACAEPLAQGVGQAMAGAGGALAGMGAELAGTGGSIMAGAGAVLTTAGHALAGTGSGGTGGTAHADTGLGAAAVPNGRWVLRDKDGVAIDAMINPYMPQPMQELHFGKHADAVPECVGIDYLGSKRVGLTYRLDTGRIATMCNGTSAITTNTENLFYLDATCSGTAYWPTSSGPSMAVVLDGHPYYAELAETIKTSATAYTNRTGQCSATTVLGTNVTLAPMRPVPAPYDALSAAPYTLALEY